MPMIFMHIILKIAGKEYVNFTGLKGSLTGYRFGNKSLNKNQKKSFNRSQLWHLKLEK